MLLEKNKKKRKKLQYAFGRIAQKSSKIDVFLSHFPIFQEFYRFFCFSTKIYEHRNVVFFLPKCMSMQDLLDSFHIYNLYISLDQENKKYKTICGIFQKC